MIAVLEQPRSRAKAGAASHPCVLFIACASLGACTHPSVSAPHPPLTAAVGSAAPSSGTRFAGTWRLSFDGTASTPSAELSLTDRGAVPEGEIIIVGRRGFLSGGVLTGTTTLSELPGGPGSLSGEVLAVAIRNDSIAVAVVGTAPADDGRGRARSGIALYGHLAGDSIAGFWQWASDSTSRPRGDFVLRRP